MTQEAAEAAKQPPAEQPRPKYDCADVWMLLIIMTSLAVVFLGGLGIIVGVTDFEATDVVAVVSPALAAVGTVSAGVFGYSLGTRGTAEAQKTATITAQQATTTREEAALFRAQGERMAGEIKRITTRAQEGDPTATGKRDVSLDDLKTLAAGADQLTARLGTKGQPEQ